MIRILHIVTNIYDPEKTTKENIGGLEIQTYRLIKKLTEKGILVDIISLNKLYKTNNRINCYIPKKNKGIFKMFHLFIECIKLLAQGEYSIVHVHANGGLFPIIISLISKLVFKNTTINTFHCCRNITYKARPIEFFVKTLINYLEKQCIRKSDFNVFLSELVLDKLKKKNIIKTFSKNIVIGDAIDVKNCPHQDVMSKKIVFIGRISHEKGWNIFLECAKKLKHKDYEFIMYGGGPEEKKLRKKIDRYKLENFHYYGIIKNEDVREVLLKSKIVVIPSIYEELGSVVLEAGMMKKTVIASNVGALKEILTDGRGVLVKMGEIDEFCLRINEEMNSLNTQKGELLYQYVHNNFSLDDISEKYLSVYNSAINSIKNQAGKAIKKGKV